MAAVMPWRGEGGSVDGRPAGLPLPPARMPPLRGGRPLKRWRYVGGYGEDVMLCVGYARLGLLPQGWWAVWDRTTGSLREQSAYNRCGVALPVGRVRVRSPDVAIDLSYTARGHVETVSPHGSQHIWTAKADLSLTGTLMIAGEPRHVELSGLIDDTSGYHARHTSWRWTAGVGTTVDGRAVTWNLVTGVHDDASVSERTVWVDGIPHHVAGAATFADDLSWVEAGGTRLDFTPESSHAHENNLLFARSNYEQPFGTFSGALPHAGPLATGYGVMERHDVRW